jgi:4-amino-4-deoxy-L-arabinose transferase-like glycosyltransferase
VIAVLGVSLLVRLAWAVLVPVIPVSDASVYDELAMNLVAGYGYAWGPGQPTAAWPVGTPVVFALLYEVFGHHYEPIVTLNVLLGVGIVAETLILARSWFNGPIALLAGMMVALWPSLVEFTTIPASELPFVFLVLGAWVALTHENRGSLPMALLGGVLLAAASFVRPTALVLPPVLLIPEAYRRREVTRPIQMMLIVGFTMALCIFPWSSRNLRVFGERYLISTNGGTNFWMGNNPESNGLYQSVPAQYDSLNEPERDRLLRQVAMDYIREYPGRFLLRTLVKFVRLHERQSVGVVWNEPGMKSHSGPAGIFAIKLATNLYWWMALLIAAGGLLRLVRTQGLIAALFHPAVFFWFCFASLHAVIVVTDRYNLPLVPPIAILGASVLHPWLNRKNDLIPAS